MIQSIRKINFVAVMVITGMLLWGLSFSSSADVIYYAFVMQKQGSNWVLPTSKIKQGSYRFQIVKFDSASPKWIALRGEFEFEWENPNDHSKGVKIKQKSTLDNIDNASCVVDEDHSVWDKTNSKCSWEKAVQKWVKPLIDKQKKERNGGDADPNFIRFLIKNSVYKWNIGKKQYYIHRIHYLFKKDSSLIDSNLKVLSRFINPAEVETNDIATLRKWINGQNDFKLAGYLGKANTEHKTFYIDFKSSAEKFFLRVESSNKEKTQIDASGDNVSKTKQPNKAKNGLAPLSWEWIFFIVVLFIIIAGVLYWMFTNDDNNNDGAEENYEDWDTEKRPHNRTPSILSKIKDFFYRFKSVKKHHNGESRRDGIDSHYPQQHNVTTNNHSDKPPYLQIDEPVSATIPSPTLPPVDYVSKEDLRMGLEDNLKTMRAELIKIFDDLITERLNQFSQQPNEALTKQVKAEVSAYSDNFQKALSAKLQKVDVRLGKLEAQGKPTPITRQNRPSITRKHQIETRSEYIPVDFEEKPTPITPPKPQTNDTINQIKTNLVSMRSVDEAGLNALDTNVDPCTFVTNVVANCLKLNQPLTHYQRLDSAIQNLTNRKVSLIVSKPGEDINSNEHNVVSQQTVSRGRLNVVASLTRPGVRCDNVVKRKAEVIQNV